MVIKFFVIKLFLTLDDRQLRSAVCVFSNKCAHRIFRCLSSSHPARKWCIINLKFCRNIYSTVYKTIANQRTIQLNLSLLWRLNPRPPEREFTWLFHASFDVSRWITVFWWIATRVSQCSSFTAVIRAECTWQGRRWRGCKGTGTRRLRSGL